MTKSALATNNGALLFLKKMQAIPMNSRQWKLKILLLVGRRRTAKRGHKGVGNHYALLTCKKREQALEYQCR